LFSVSLFRPVRRLFRRLVDYRYTLIEKRCKYFLLKNDNFFSKNDEWSCFVGRKLAPGKLIIASHNSGKIKEINELVAPFGLEAISAADFGLSSPEETENTFAGNAAIKAHAASAASGLPALADDSGIEVAILGGAPGVYTADWAETPDGRDFDVAMERTRREMEALGAFQPGGDTRARFVCCLCVAWPDGHEEVFLGKVDGAVSFPKRGDKGFGYDPIFTPDGEAETFAEMDPVKKHAMSHRADAFRQLVDACLK
jgi:XTP/dITP diphosphohydrolase